MHVMYAVITKAASAMWCVAVVSAKPDAWSVLPAD